MSLRIKLFLAIVLFFSIALSFFGYTAYSSGITASSSREMMLLQDLVTGLSHDIYNDIGSKPDEASIKAWLREFNSLHLSIMVATADNAWLSNAAKNEIPTAVKERIMTTAKSGSMPVDEISYIWDTSKINDTPYTLSLIHRNDAHEASFFWKRFVVPLLIAALFVIWAAIWSAMYIASLMEKLHTQKNKLQHQATHDALTNLPNRTLMMERLNAEVHSLNADNTEFALLFIDLNRFKEINDTLGHHFGDMLLVEIARRLSAVLRKSDMVSRLGGDEFAVILGSVTEQIANTIAEKLIGVIGEVIEIGGNKLFVSASIGIARYPQHSKDTNMLVQCADIAMYAAKRSGAGYVIYDAKLDAHSRDKLKLTNALRDAIERGQMSVHYLAKADVQTGAVIGAEALLRWQHETLGMIPPDRFIPLAEQSGLMRSLTEYVLDKAMQDLQVLSSNGHDITMAINLSAVSLHDPELPNILTRVAESRNIAASKIVLEITETAVMDQAIYTSDVLRKLDQLGFRISMDDFGTGHSSLVNLRLLPLQEIKIDRSFVMNMLNNDDDATIVRTIIELAHSLGKKVVAEGVETGAIMHSLTMLGCDIAQGHFISRPVPMEVFMLWLDEKKKATNDKNYYLKSV